MTTNSLFTTLSGGGLLKKVNLKGFRGFTLAEVLITLVIIGVIASMTIPTLINKTNNHELVSRLKKSYSTLTQVTNKIIAEEGNPRADIGGWATSAEVAYNMYKRHLGLIKECTNGVQGCFAGYYKPLNGTVANSTFDTVSNSYRFIMADGAEFYVSQGSLSSDCTHSANGSSHECFRIVIDVNGQKKPNTVGRDVFAFGLKEEGLVPVGCETNVLCNTNESGWACACRVLRENAMNY